MNTQQYCRGVEQEERHRDELLSTVTVQDDQSPLVALKDAGFHLIFEPSMMEGYEYRVREAVCEKIGRISQRLEEQDKVLIIRSVWRSFDHQRRLWATKAAVMRLEHPDRHEDEIMETVSHFIALPEESMHATGGAVDALISDLKTDRVLDFGNNEGVHLELNETCYPLHPEISDEARQNRKLLMGLFDEEDFVVDVVEYWHFDHGNVNWAAGKGKKIARYGVIKEIAG